MRSLSTSILIYCRSLVIPVPILASSGSYGKDSRLAVGAMGFAGCEALFAALPLTLGVTSSSAKLSTNASTSESHMTVLIIAGKEKLAGICQLLVLDSQLEVIVSFV